MDAQCEADNHGAEAVVLDQCPSREIVNNAIDHLVWKGLQPQLIAVEVNLSLDLLPHKIPTFNFDGIHSEVSEKERENPRSHDHPMGGGRDAGKTQQNSDIVLLCIYFLSN